MAQSLTDVLADLILAESSVGVIETGATAKSGDFDNYLNRKALALYAKKALPAIAEAIEYLHQLKKERDSTSDSKNEN